MNLSGDSNSTLHSSDTVQLLYVQNLIYYVANVINVILSLPANAYVLWLIVTGPKGTVASDLFGLNLAVTEILSSLSSLGFIIYYYQDSEAVYNFALFFKGFIYYGRSPFQSCICVERYLAVIHPVTFLKYKPVRYRMGCSGVVWMLVIGTCIGYMFSNATPAWKSYALSFILVQFLVMLFCCQAVLRALKHPGPVDGEGEGTNHIKQRAFKIISTILVFAVVMYLPRLLLLLSFNFIDSVKFYFALCVCFLITVIFGFLQPVLYLHRAGKLPCIGTLLGKS
ncbi:hypothetical protein DPEC_G00181150 [Dallia pectoralis]|uniref:Uncharacterized protein n=1 Tax=Dallia pectoralis TaxID=75939 RepID=A0ACC2GA01_DALPE|nr:hypothetical protein DPEC_G00181150 [Dallia pectoralis]